MVSTVKEKNEDIIYDLKSIASKLVHRGPDDFGIWTDPKHGLGLLHIEGYQ